jgi:hypothetical protein
MIVVAVIAAIVAIAAPVAALALPASQAAPTVQITMSATELEIAPGTDSATFQAFVTSSEALGGAVVSIPIPEGTTLSSSYVGQPGQGVGTVVPGAVVWDAGDIAANTKVGPFAMVVTYGEGADLPSTSANITWATPVAGSATSPAASPPEEREAPSRGCMSCHAPGSRYNLKNEAEGHSKNVGLTHPTLDPNVSERDCYACHGEGTGARAGMGNVASLTLRDIVHPGHLFSPHFQGDNGTCFTCHNVDEKGNWRILSDSYAVNVYGMPENSPIGGWLPNGTKNTQE